MTACQAERKRNLRRISDLRYISRIRGVATYITQIAELTQDPEAAARNGRREDMVPTAEHRVDLATERL